jgi:hypothetical protein
MDIQISGSETSMARREEKEINFQKARELRWKPLSQIMHLRRDHALSHDYHNLVDGVLGSKNIISVLCAYLVTFIHVYSDPERRKFTYS